MCKDCGCGSGGTGYRINGKTPAELHGHSHDHPHDHEHGHDHHDHDHPHDHDHHHHDHDHPHGHDHGHSHHVHAAPLAAVHQPDIDSERVIRIERDILSNPPELMADRGMLEQVMLNIMRNAVEAMSANGMSTLDIPAFLRKQAD